MGKPEIRFKGYTDEWEQRKLKDIIEYIVDNRGKNPPYYCSEGIPVIDNFMIQNTLYPDLQTATRFIDSALYNDFIRKYNEEDDTLLTLVGNGIGNITLFPKEKAVIIQNTLGFRAKKNRKFLFFLLMANNEKLLKLDRGMAQPSIRQDEILDIDIHVPSESEQTEIGKYFTSIDNLITLHQRKCAEIKSLKKYMLQKMFPQNEQKVPEIRFEGFTEAWEQRKLGDLVDRVTRKNQDLVSELPLTISAQYGLIDQNEFFDKRVASKDVSGYYLIENGEFAYNKSTSTDAPWGAIKRLDRYENGVLSTLYIVFGIKENNPVDSDFLVSYYSTNLWHKGIHEIAAEGARNHGLLNIAPADFFETKLMIPQDIEEQKKIGKYFEELERLITLHQQKCEELKKIKKFMLQKMFV